MSVFWTLFLVVAFCDLIINWLTFLRGVEPSHHEIQYAYGRGRQDGKNDSGCNEVWA